MPIVPRRVANRKLSDTDRWDSSDPERNPPPLPLNPQSPKSSLRPGTGSAIQSAHAALAERAREHAATLVPSALVRRANDPSPTRGPGVHKRMQSLQPGTVRDLSFQLETFNGSGNNGGNPQGQHSNSLSSSPTKSYTTPIKHRDSVGDFRLSEKDHKGDLTPTLGPSLTPVVRPTVRRAQHSSILGENTPPQSATMLALQNMAPFPPKEFGPPLGNVTNGSTGLPKGPLTIDSLSTQLLALTNIATSLQKEMNQLSRRSRDNATDLLSLKEATNARDEDIRRSLRELLTNTDASVRPSTRDAYNSGLYIDNKPHHSTSPASKTISRPYSLPRIPSPTSFAASIDRESTETPSLYGGDSQPIMNVLERVARDMGTREGQEEITQRLAELLSRMSGVASSEKLEQIVEIIRSRLDHAIMPLPQAGSGGNGGNRGGKSALTAASPDEGPRKHITFDLDEDRGSTRPPSGAPTSPSDIIGEDFVNIIKSIKDSVSQSGGITAEVKALVRELRGEILGMGREIGRKLEQASSGSGGSVVSDAASTLSTSSGKDEVAQIIDEGLGKMKDQLNNILREHRRHSTASTQPKTPVFDYQEIYNAMRNALKDGQASSSQALQLSRDDVVEAVRDVWENYKPELESRNVGLERDEVLACLKQGIDEYAATSKGASKDDVFQAMVEALKTFVPPRVDTPASLSRDEILDAVRECLEEFEFPVAPGASNAELTRDDMVYAVKEGLIGLELPVSNALVPAGGNDEAITRLREVIEGMRDEFKTISEEARNTADASEHDSAIILDATKEGLDKLRTDIESYIDKAGGSASSEEFMDGVAKTLDAFKIEMVDLVSKMTVDSKALIEGQIDNFRDVLAGSVVPTSNLHAPREEAWVAVRDGLDAIRGDLRQSTGRLPRDLEIVRDTLNDLRISIDELTRRARLQDPNDPVMEEVRSNLIEVQADLKAMREESQKTEGAMVRIGSDDETPDEGAADSAPAEPLKHEDIKGLEVLISQLQSKVEGMEPDDQHQPSKEALAQIEELVGATASKDDIGRVQELLEGAVSKEDLDRIESLLNSLQQTVDVIATREPSASAAGATEAREPVERTRPPLENPEDPATREDMEAVETLLRNTKARIDDLMDGEQAVRKDHIDALEALVNTLGETVTAARTDLDNISRREDFTAIQVLIKDVVAALEEQKEANAKQLEDLTRVTKADTDTIQHTCSDIKTRLEKTDLAEVSTKEDVRMVETLLRETKEVLDHQNEASSKALMDRQVETAGVGDRVLEVKEFLKQLGDMLKEKLEDGSNGVATIGTVLEKLGVTIDQNASVGQDVKDMFEAMKTEFAETKSSVAGAKLETDEKLNQSLETLGSRIDDKIIDIMTRFDGVHATLDENQKTTDAHQTETEAAVQGTKVMAEELRLLIDALGSAVTDSLEKMEEASKTVFTRVEDLFTKTDENHVTDKLEHEQTRERIQEAMLAIEGLQGNVSDHQPRLLEAIKEVMTAVSEHFTHAEETSSSLVTRFVEAIPAPPPLPAPEKYDDTMVIERLDMLVDHSQTAAAAFSRFEALDDVRRQVTDTAKSVSDLLSQQAKKMEDEQEDRDKMLQDTSLALERRLVQKEEAELSIDRLRDEERRLRESVESLRSDEQSMMRQKMKLAADVSSLETALLIRREELEEMETRAEELERRILDGAMNYSRLMAMGKVNKTSDAMNRKRVKPHKDKEGAQSSARMALAAAKGQASTAANRRIVSLSQIPNNTVAGIKRSHSVKTPGGAGAKGALRKTSWGSSLAKSSQTHTAPGADKENAGDENMSPSDGDDLDKFPLDAETGEADSLRRLSGMTTIVKGIQEDAEGEAVAEAPPAGEDGLGEDVGAPSDRGIVEVYGDEVEIAGA